MYQSLCWVMKYEWTKCLNKLNFDLTNVTYAQTFFLGQEKNFST